MLRRRGVHLTRLLVMMVLLAGPAGANPARMESQLRPGAAGPSLDRTGSDRNTLRQEVELRYRVVPVQNGVALIPRNPGAAVRSVEVSGGRIAVDGTAVTGAELSMRMGEDSGRLLSLSYLDPEALRRLFGLPPIAAPPETPAPTSPAPEPQVPGETTGPAQTSPEEVHSETKVRIGGSLRVEENEVVGGPVVAVGGSATVNGAVRDDVVAVGGSVRLGPKARVAGDVTAVGGTIEREPGARVDGQVNEIGFSLPQIHLRPLGRWRPFGVPGPWTGARPSVDLLVTGLRMLVLGFFACLVLLIAPAPTGRIEQTLATEPWRAGFVGLLAQVLIVPILVLTVVLLAVSIIGIPLLLLIPPLAVVALLIALILGFAGAALRVGRWAEGRFGWAPQGAYVLLLIGLIGIWSLTVFGRMISVAGWIVWFLSAMFLVVGFVVEYVAWTCGLGAAILTRFGRRAAGGQLPVSQMARETPHEEAPTAE